MIFTNPNSLILLLVIPGIIVLHFIRRHRTRITVASTFLWEEVLRSRKRKFYLQTLLRNLPLILQILIAALLVFAVSDPLITARTGRREDAVILVVDTSASMKSMDGNTTRFEKAIDEAWDVVQDLGSRTPVAVVSGGAAPSVSGPFTTDKLDLRNHLRGLAATDEPGNMQTLLVTAAGIAPPESRYRLVLFSDGAFDLERRELLKEFPLEYVAVGDDASNVGLVAFEFRKPVNRRSEYEILVGIENFSGVPYKGNLTMSAEQGEIIEHDVSLLAFERATLVFPYNGLLARRIRVELSPGDSFSVDNTAFAVLGDDDPVDVLLVSPGNYFLEQLLESHPNIEVSVADPAADPVGFEVVVFDRVNPPLDFIGQGIMIGAVDPSSMNTPESILINPEVTGWDNAHPLVKSVDLTGFSIFRSLAVPRADPAIHSVVHSGVNSIVYTIKGTAKSFVGISFDISESDLPLRTAFPVLMSNILTWLVPASTSGPQASTGSFYVLDGAPSADMRVTGPDGSAGIVVRDGESVYVSGLDSTGFYTVEDGITSKGFAVNLLDPDESDIAPRFEAWESAMAGQMPDGVSYRPIRLILILLALLVLIGEWIAWLRNKA